MKKIPLEKYLSKYKINNDRIYVRRNSQDVARIYQKIQAW